MVGGASKPCARLCGLGPPGDGLALCDCLSAGALRNLLIACRFSAFFLGGSIKKRTFAEKFNV